MDRFPTTLETNDGPPGVIDATRLLLSFKKSREPEAVQATVNEVGLELEPEPFERRTGAEINHTDRRFWVRSVDGAPIDSARFETIEGRLRRLLDWIGPVYRAVGQDGRTALFCPLPNVILLPSANQELMAQAIEVFGLTVSESKTTHLGGYVYLEVPDLDRANALEIRGSLQADDAIFETMPMVRNWCAIPNDPMFAQQWNMNTVQAPQAWDISIGTATTVIAVIDSGTDLTHPDLLLAGQGIDLGDMMSDGSPNNFGTNTGHGTCCSGIAAAIIDNTTGVAGLAGSCGILPLAISTFSNVEIANGVNWAVAQGATVISMSFTIPQSALVDTALATAFAANVVLCAATGNGNALGVGYPARHPDVMAIGASDQVDNRKTPASPDGETWWGSNFGPELSVVAPGVLIPSTDIQGAGGYNTTAGAGGNFFAMFNGTSSATPLVAGLVGLIRSEYPMLSSAQVRSLVEQSAAKVGVVPYVETPGRPNGTWNNEMGYGRINAFRALDHADVMIKDWPGDAGVEPSTSGNFWDFSDIVVRITDDNVFNPGNPSQSKHVERGQTNYIYVQVTNRGPRDARNVAVNLRLTPYVGLQFVYPDDWSDVDATHVAPTTIVGSFPSVPSGSTVLAKFSISSSQVESLYGWQTNHPWHPCLLAQVTADNDYAYVTSDLSFGNIVVRKNNFAQRNLTVIDVFAGALMSFPFVIGSSHIEDQVVRLGIDRSRMPEKARIELVLDGNEALLPHIDFTPSAPDDGPRTGEVVFDDPTRLIARVGCCDVRLTLEKGSRIALGCDEPSPLVLGDLRGGEFRVTDGVRVVAIPEAMATIDLRKAPRSMHPLALRIAFPMELEASDDYTIVLWQANETGTTVGGATVIYRVP